MKNSSEKQDLPLQNEAQTNFQKQRADKDVHDKMVGEYREQIEVISRAILDEDFVKAQNLYNKLEPILKKKFTPSELALDFYFDIGNTYSNGRKQQKAINEYHKSRVLLEGLYMKYRNEYYKESLLSLYNRLHESYMYMNQYKKALFYLDKVIEIRESQLSFVNECEANGINICGSLWGMYTDKARLLGEMGKSEEAKIFEEKAEKISGGRTPMGEYYKKLQNMLNDTVNNKK